MGAPVSWLSLVLALFSCGEPARDEPSERSPRGGASGAAGSGMTGGAGNAGGTSGAGGAGGMGGEGTGGSGAASGSGGGSSECNQLPGDAPDYEVTYSPEPAPAGEGGTVVDGAYFATSEIWYETPPGPSVTLGGIRIELEGPLWEEVDGWPSDDVVNPDFRRTRYFSAEGTSLTVTALCPVHGASETFGYTARGDTLTLYVREGDLTYGITFTRT